MLLGFCTWWLMWLIFSFIRSNIRVTWGCWKMDMAGRNLKKQCVKLKCLTVTCACSQPYGSHIQLTFNTLLRMIEGKFIDSFIRKILEEFLLNVVWKCELKFLAQYRAVLIVWMSQLHLRCNRDNLQVTAVQLSIIVAVVTAY